MANQTIIAGRTGTLALAYVSTGKPASGSDTLAIFGYYTLRAGGPVDQLSNGFSVSNFVRTGDTATIDLSVPSTFFDDPKNFVGDALSVRYTIAKTGEQFSGSLSITPYIASTTAPTPPVPAAPAPVAKPAPPVPAPAPVTLVQPVKISVEHDAPCTITQAAMTLGEGAASWPNVPLASDPPGKAATHTLTGTVPYPLAGFVRGLAAATVTFLADGAIQTRMEIVTLLGEGEGLP